MEHLPGCYAPYYEPTVSLRMGIAFSLFLNLLRGSSEYTAISTPPPEKYPVTIFPLQFHGSIHGVDLHGLIISNPASMKRSIKVQ
jgi:hypothetical protein